MESPEINLVEIQINVLFVVSLWEVVHMDKHNAKTRKKLKQISSVKDFESLMEQTMLSEEEKEDIMVTLQSTGVKQECENMEETKHRT